MTSKSSGPARCKHKSLAQCSACQHHPNLTEQMGVWVTPPQHPTDYPSFVRDNQDALRTSTKNTTKPQTQSQIQPQSEKTTQQPTSSNNKSNNSQRPHRHHPSLAYSNLKHAQKAATTTSSVAATRANSPVTHRTTTPVSNPRQALPASANAAVVARSYSRALTPQAANQLSARMARTTIAPVPELEDSEEESERSSEDSSDEDDDE